MNQMFYNYSSLTSLDLSNCNTEKANNFSKIFFCCSSLYYLNLSIFDLMKINLNLFLNKKYKVISNNKRILKELRFVILNM